METALDIDSPALSKISQWSLSCSMHDHLVPVIVVQGIEGGEIMSSVEIAMIGNVPYQKLRDAVLAHPTLAESLNNIWGSLE